MAAPAKKITVKFGGARPLAAALGITPTSVYRWNYPRERGGSAGYIPTRWIPRIKELAELSGVKLTATDWNA